MLFYILIECLRVIGSLAMIIFLFTSLLHFLIVFFKRPERPPKVLSGKHVVIAGGSSGIGFETAIECVKRGANVTVLARQKAQLLIAKEEIKKHVVNPNQFIKTLALDVTDTAIVKIVMNLMWKDAPIYMLVNCAGMAVVENLEATCLTEIREMIDVNLYGTINTTRAVIGLMKLRGDGIIVNVSSQSGLVGMCGHAAYAASKFAVRGFTEALEMELRPYNIYVTLAVPRDSDNLGVKLKEGVQPILDPRRLLDPKLVSKQLVKDALAGRFYSYVGIPSAFFTNLCVGMTPYNSLWQLYLQGLLLGPMRILGSMFTFRFQRMYQYYKDKNVYQIYD